jgi:hypothetical protein
MLSIIVCVCHFVGGRDVVQYTPAGAMEKKSLHGVAFFMDS